MSRVIAAPGELVASMPTGEPAVLIVGGDSTRRAGVRAAIESLAGCDEAASVDAALAAAERRAYDVVLIDRDLPAPGASRLAALIRRDDDARAPAVELVDHRSAAGPGHPIVPSDPLGLRRTVELSLALQRERARAIEQERRLIEQERELERLTLALAEASAASRTKDLYMGVLGHDLRNPLGAILMSARTMLMRGSLTGSDQQALSRIARNGERMAALIRDILDYTRGQAAGGIPIVPRPTDMREICASLIEEMTLLHADRAIHLVGEGETAGCWDRERVEQVVSNLLTNALTHGEGAVTVSVGGTSSQAVIAIHNHGAIPPAQLPELFEPFRRGAASRAGLGLGLYIVREILRAHRGEVEVESSPEHGTTFTTRWPRGEPAPHS